MSNKSQILHEEVVRSMIAQNVDPFERPFRPYDDALLSTTTANTTASPSKAQMKYMREFSKNLKYVEAKSNVKMDQDYSNQRKPRKCPHRIRHVQDVRRPHETSYCKFLPMSSGTNMFDGQIFFPLHPVAKLVEDMGSSVSQLASPNGPDRESLAMSPIRPLKSKKNSTPLQPVSAVKTLRKVKVAYGDIGTPLPGGKMSLGPTRPPPITSATQNCTMPTTVELDGGLGSPLRSLRGGSMGVAQRFMCHVAEATAASPGGTCRTLTSPDSNTFAHMTVMHRLASYRETISTLRGQG